MHNRTQLVRSPRASGITIHALTHSKDWPQRRSAEGSRGGCRFLPCQFGLLPKETWAFVTPELRHLPPLIHATPQLVPWEGGLDKTRPSEGGCDSRQGGGGAAHHPGRRQGFRPGSHSSRGCSHPVGSGVPQGRRDRTGGHALSLRACPGWAAAWWAAMWGRRGFGLARAAGRALPLTGSVKPCGLRPPWRRGLAEAPPGPAQGCKATVGQQGAGHLGHRPCREISHWAHTCSTVRATRGGSLPSPGAAVWALGHCSPSRPS